MSDKKVLTINPELFTFSTNKTKKTRSTEPKQDNIRIKTQVNRKQDTLRKQSLLKMIRKQQEERYKRLFENNKHNPDVQPNKQPDDSNTFNREFDDARDYLDKLTKKNEMNVPKNTTFRTYPTTNVSDSSISSHTTNTHNSTTKTHNNTVKLTPSYGCLKGGSLPTYRNYINNTPNNIPKIHVGESTPLVSNIPGVQLHNDNKEQSALLGHIQNKPSSIVEHKISDGMKRMGEIKQQQDIFKKMGLGGKPKKMKRKKTLRRTYKIGRSSVSPTISVLVSNKTLRNRITTKGQLLKQTPIQDVRKYLIKQGIIRVGSTTPNDILRKMYESLALVCGEIKNHNPDTLLYNYINDTE